MPDIQEDAVKTGFWRHVYAVSKALDLLITAHKSCFTILVTFKNGEVYYFEGSSVGS